MRSACQKWGRHLPWALLGLVIVARLANFWGLHFGNTDDISTDYARMTLPFRTMVHDYAASQSRIQFIVSAPLWAAIMSVAGTPWYDFVNLGMFSLSVLLPLWALRKYYLPGNAFFLYAAALFATLPLLFSYAPPYSYPLWMSFPVTACGVALLLFQRSQTESAGKLWWLLAGFVAAFFAVCAYEAAIILNIVILSVYFAASHAGRPWRDFPRRRDLQCAFAALVCFVCLYFPFRAAHPPAYEGVQASTTYLTLPSIARVVGTLSVTSSVFAWFVRPQWAYHIGHDSDAIPLQATLSWQHATISEIAFACLTGTLVFVWIVRPGGKTVANPLRLALLALLLLLAPNAAYPLTQKISSLVVKRQLFAYTATPYSQIGFACAFAALAVAAARIPVAFLRMLAAAVLSIFLACGSLAASAFNRESAVFAREQAARWKVIRYLAACSAELPQSYRENLVAPRLWKIATAGLSWGDPVQDELYWDAFAFYRYRLRLHLAVSAGNVPEHRLDFRLARNGSLQSVILTSSIDGRHLREAWLIPASAATELPRQPAATQAIVPCGRDGLQALHVTGDDLQLGPLMPLAPPPAAPAAPPPADAPELSPPTGGGMDQIFQVKLSPQDQGETVRTVGLLINGMKSGVDGCYVFWDLLKHQSLLVNDNGEDSKPPVPHGAIVNRQCELLDSGSTYTSDGKTFTVTYHVRFHDSFQGLKQMYLFRKNTKGGNSGLRRMGWWWVE